MRPSTLPGPMCACLLPVAPVSAGTDERPLGMDRREHERAAMSRALELACTPGVPLSPNPRVGCVLLAPDGTTLATGHHRGAGTPHAEADALAQAGDLARGATAVVSLEPCNHTGRTGPCAAALVEAGVARVVFAQVDPNPQASGGAATLRAAGVEVEHGVLADLARAVNPAWTFAMEHQRPFVTWKLAATLDGRSAAADGTSRWVSSPASRQDAQSLRADCDAIMVGTGTVLVDDPRLTRRDEAGADLPRERQITRVVMGVRELPPEARVLDDAAPTALLTTRDPGEALAALHAREVRHLLLEGGPTLAAAYLSAGLVDEVVAYVAPMLLGSGLSAVGDLGIGSITGAVHLDVADVTVLGTGADRNVRITAAPRRRSTAGKD